MTNKIHLTNAILHKIAKNIPPDDHAPSALGLYLGLSNVEMECIEAEQDLDSVVLRVFNVLCKWRDKRLRDKQNADVLNELRSVLENEKFDRALEILNDLIQPSYNLHR